MNPVGDLAHHLEVMADEQIGQAVADALPQAQARRDDAEQQEQRAQGGQDEVAGAARRPRRRG